MRRAWRRCGCAAVMAIGLAGLTAVPSEASNIGPHVGPLEIRIFGANGDVRDFLARSAEDRRGADALVNQINGAIQGPAQPIDEAAVMLPHYRIEVSRLGPTYITAPWARLSETSFIYFPGGQAAGFMVVEFTQGQAALDQRWILPAPEVAALLERHLQGLPPIGLGPGPRETASAPWNMALGAVLLAGISLRLFVARRRSVLSEKKKERWKGDGPALLKVAGGLVADLEAGHVVLRDRIGAVSVRGRSSSWISGVDGPGLTALVEHRPGR